MFERPSRHGEAYRHGRRIRPAKSSAGGETMTTRFPMATMLAVLLLALPVQAFYPTSVGRNGPIELTLDGPATTTERTVSLTATVKNTGDDPISGKVRIQAIDDWKAPAEGPVVLRPRQIATPAHCSKPHAGPNTLQRPIPVPCLCRLRSRGEEAHRPRGPCRRDAPGRSLHAPTRPRFDFKTHRGPGELKPRPLACPDSPNGDPVVRSGQEDHPSATRLERRRVAPPNQRIVQRIGEPRHSQAGHRYPPAMVRASRHGSHRVPDTASQDRPPSP